MIPESVSHYGTGSIARTLVGMLSTAPVVINQVFDPRNVGTVVCELPFVSTCSNLVDSEIKLIDIKKIFTIHCVFTLKYLVMARKKLASSPKFSMCCITYAG